MSIVMLSKTNKTSEECQEMKESWEIRYTTVQLLQLYELKKFFNNLPHKLADFPTEVFNSQPFLEDIVETFAVAFALFQCP